MCLRKSVRKCMHTNLTTKHCNFPSNPICLLSMRVVCAKCYMLSVCVCEREREREKEKERERERVCMYVCERVSV